MTLRAIPPDTPLRCPLCDVLMVYVRKLHMWRCPVPNCRLEVWPPLPQDDDRDYRTPQELFDAMSRPPGGMIKRGGKSGVGRKRRKPKKRKKWYREREE